MKEILSCPECGASQTEDVTCWDQFCAVLGWEWQDHELQTKHFLTVASYNLQHPSRFTDEAIVGLRETFRDHLKDGLPISEIRKQVSQALAGSQTVLKKAKDQNLVPCEWKMTIADVFHSNQPEGAAKRVQKWAESILEEIRNH